MTISKSKGITRTERLLARLCERSFLQLWSYPNPIKDDGHELCDLLVVFEKHVFIFFDREIVLDDAGEKDAVLQWNRWKRKVIDAQIKTAHGAERYLRSGRPAFLDPKCQLPFPVSIDRGGSIYHKIIVAHGAKEACERFSDSNVYGSLGISYGLDHELPFPFTIDIDKGDPVHVLDSHNLSIILAELDTIADFSAYLDAKIEAIQRYDLLTYCGEEDLLAHYFMNFDAQSKRHFIGTDDPTINAVLIGEGEWKDFVASDLYKNTKEANRVSYFWDELLQRTCENEVDGKLLGDSILADGRSAIHEMAKEPRFSRRALSAEMLDAMRTFPAPTPGMLSRKLNLMPSYYAGKAYVFLQLAANDEISREPDYRDRRRVVLEIACGAAKNKFETLTTIVGIGMDAAKFSEDVAEDFVLMDAHDWPAERRAFYADQNQGFAFFQSDSLRKTQRTVTEFVAPAVTKRGKIGRNERCPCGSGKKYKRCHMR